MWAQMDAEWSQEVDPMEHKGVAEHFNWETKHTTWEQEWDPKEVVLSFAVGDAN